MDDSENINFSIPANDLAVQTNIDDLVCMICMNICFKAVLITCCERLMCLNCIKMMIKLSTSIKCPHCNNVNINFVRPSKLINRMFENLTFFCPNKNLGCEEKIKYYFYFDHVFNLCQFKKNSKNKYCKNCMDVFSKESTHMCNNIHYINDKNSNLSFLEKTLNSLYDNSLVSPETNINKHGIEPKIGNNNNSQLNENIFPRGTILLPRLHNHKLTLTTDRLNPGYEQGWVCELCNDNIRNPSTASYHCEPCVYDVCEKCYIYISSRVQNTSSHNHELNLEIRNLEWECNICAKDYYMRRSWYCDVCNFDVCIFCYWK